MGNGKFLLSIPKGCYSKGSTLIRERYLEDFLKDNSIKENDEKKVQENEKEKKIINELLLRTPSILPYEVKSSTVPSIGTTY